MLVNGRHLAPILFVNDRTADAPARTPSIGDSLRVPDHASVAA